MTAKLITGFALTFILTYFTYRYERQALLADLGAEVAAVMLVHNVTDGAARWTDANNNTFRIARLTGSADQATRAKITAELAKHPGIHQVIWR